MSYLRVWIEFTLENTSDLHIGDGSEAKLEARGKVARAARFGVSEASMADDTDQQKAQYARVYREHAAKPLKPYVPGSTLRGLLRRLVGDAPELEFLFGSKRQAKDLSASALVVEDAVWQASGVTKTDHLPFYDATCDSYVRHATAIDPITGAVADGKLFSYELVPSGAKFEVKLRIEAPTALSGKFITDAHITALRQVFAQLNGASSVSALGAGTGLGMGRVKLTDLSFKALTVDAFAAWVSGTGHAKPPQTPLTFTEAMPAPNANLHTLTLRFISPLMCSDPNRKKPTPQNLSVSQKAEFEDKPSQAFLRDASGNPMIPARSLRGAARARARKIVATMALQKPGMDISKALNVADELIKELFGSEAKRCLVQFTDARATAGAQSKMQTQTFNAIDRFTGGVADGKLYSAEWADNPTLHTELSFRGTLEPWHKGVLTLLARDAAEGDLALGWGKAKGFGRFLLASTSLPTFGPGIDTKWLAAVAALEQKIVAEILKLQAEEQTSHG